MFKRLANKIKNSDSNSVFKGMLTLAMGSGAARAIGFASIPIITRLYSPEDYGVLALYTSVVVILVPFATLKYSTAIPLPKRDGMAINIVALGLLLILFLSLLIGIPLFVFGETILAWFNMVELAQWWWLIVLGIAGTAIYELFSLWGTRKRKYNVIAKTQFMQSLIGNGVKILLGWLAFKSFGLVFGQFLAQSAGTGGLIKGSFQDFKNNINQITWRRIKFASKYYREFPYYRLPSQLLLKISGQAPILMMAALYSKEATGQLSLAMMAVSLPVGLIGNSMAQAFYAEIAHLGRTQLGRIKEVAIEVQKKLFLTGVPCTVVLVFLAEPTFSLIFGENWVKAGAFAAILGPFVLLQLTSAPLIQVLNVLGSQKIFLIINVARIVGLSSVFLIFQLARYSEVSLVITISAFLTLFYLVTSGFIFFAIQSAVKNVKKNGHGAL